MKNLKILLVCACLFLSGIYTVRSQDNEFKAKPATTKKGFPDIFRPIGNLFSRIFGKKRESSICYLTGVTELTLTKSEVILPCSAKSDICSNQTQSIEISTIVFNPYNDVLIYKYEVSGGKIIGEGAKVIWNLSDVKPGAYIITAAVDDGCGFCGTTQTKTITVKECPNCN